MKKEKMIYKMLNKEYKVKLHVDTYTYNGIYNLFVGLLADNRYQEPFCDITVNLDGALPPFHGYVKSYGPGQDGVIDFLERYGLAESTGELRPTGYVIVPLYRFNADKLRELDPQGVAEYEQKISKKGRK